MPEGSEGTAGAAGTAPAPAPGAAAPPARRRGWLSARRLRLIVVVAVVAVIVLILLWGMVPERILEVREVLRDAPSHDGEDVQVKGTVRDWNATAGNFTLVDSSDGTKVIHVHRGGSFPEGFGEGVSVIVTGGFSVAGDRFEVEASNIQVGCPSKY